MAASKAKRAVKSEANPHIVGAAHKGRDTGKAVRKNAVIAAEKAKYGVGVVAGAAVLAGGVAFAFGRGMFRGILGR